MMVETKAAFTSAVQSFVDLVIFHTVYFSFYLLIKAAWKHYFSSLVRK